MLHTYIYKSDYNSMCMKNSSEMKTLCHTFRLRRHSKRFNLRVIGLKRLSEVGKEARKKNLGAKREMEVKNLRLYMENKSIMEENKKLRERALLLHIENQALLSQFNSI